MRKVVIFYVVVLLWLFIQPQAAHTSEKTGFAFEAEAYFAYAFWENNYAHEKSKSLGPGLFISPKMQKQLGRVTLAIDATLSAFRFNGPDGLTITGPDDDIDAGFRTRLSRRDLALQAGFDLPKFIHVSANASYHFFKLDGDHKAPGVRYEYLEKGILFGPALGMKRQLKKSTVFLDVSYLIGYFDTDYFNTSRSSRVSKNEINAKQFAGAFGVQFSFTKSCDLCFSYRFEYHARSPKSSIYGFHYNVTDSWLHGLATTLRYSL